MSGWRKGRAGSLVLTGFVFVFGACAGSDVDWVASDRTPIDRWLHCTECQDGELAAVLELGQAAVGPLQTVVSQGPSADRIQARRDELGIEYDALQARMGAELRRSRVEYIDSYVAKYHDATRVRAIEALREIGTQEARDALEAIQPGTLSEDVEQLRVEALAALSQGGA